MVSWDYIYTLVRTLKFKTQLMGSLEAWVTPLDDIQLCPPLGYILPTSSMGFLFCHSHTLSLHPHALAIFSLIASRLPSLYRTSFHLFFHQSFAENSSGARQ